LAFGNPSCKVTRVSWRDHFFSRQINPPLDDITGSLPQLTVNYKGEVVKKNLTLIKGFLVNTGAKDITKEMVEKPLAFELVEGYRCLKLLQNLRPTQRASHNR